MELRGNGLVIKAQAEAGKGKALGIGLGTHYLVECHNKNGVFKWVDEFDNLVVTDGLNNSLDVHLANQAAQSTVWYVGLCESEPVFDPTDIMNSHAGWTEALFYDEGDRQALVLDAAANGSCSNSASRAKFNIAFDGSICGGAFVTNSITKGGDTGFLYGGGAFTTGDKTLDDGDLLSLTITCTAVAVV